MPAETHDYYSQPGDGVHPAVRGIGDRLINLAYGKVESVIGEAAMKVVVKVGIITSNVAGEILGSTAGQGEEAAIALLNERAAAAAAAAKLLPNGVPQPMHTSDP